MEKHSNQIDLLRDGGNDGTLSDINGLPREDRSWSQYGTGHSSDMVYGPPKLDQYQVDANVTIMGGQDYASNVLVSILTQSPSGADLGRAANNEVKSRRGARAKLNFTSHSSWLLVDST